MITMQGPLHVQTFTLEEIRKPSPTQVARTPLPDVPLNLPINCYCSKYLATLSEQEKQLLSIKPDINLSKLLSMTKNLVSRPTPSHSISSDYSSTTVHIHNPHSHAMVHSVWKEQHRLRNQFWPHFSVLINVATKPILTWPILPSFSEPDVYSSQVILLHSIDIHESHALVQAGKGNPQPVPPFLDSIPAPVYHVNLHISLITFEC